MTKDQKIVKGKVGLLELAKQLGNVSHADSERNRPSFRFQIACDSEMKSPTIPR
jgi:hypothetical protein